MQEDAAQPNGGAVHEDKLARYPHGTFFLQRLVHGKSFLAPVLAGRGAVGNLAFAVLEQRPIDKAGPDVEYIDQLVAKADEAPGLVGVHDQSALAVQKPIVEIDDALHEGGGKGSDAAVVEQVDAAGLR